jgi:PAS domain S-box-containing protein
VRDGTRLKKTKEALESETYQEAVSNSICFGLVVVDEETHQIVDVNAYALKTIGASREQVIRKICHKFICPSEKGKCPISDLGQTVDRSERVFLRANGERIPILKTVATMMWRGHKYLVESFIDNTERKVAEDALRKSENKSRHF